MKTIEEILALIERFFEGDTTLEEEHWLYNYFKQTKDLPEELAAYRETFLGFDAIALTETDAATTNIANQKVSLTAIELPIDLDIVDGGNRWLVLLLWWLSSLAQCGLINPTSVSN